MRLDPAVLALLEDPENEQALIDLLKRLAARDQMVPPEAHEALEKAVRDADALGLPAGPVDLRVHRAPKTAPRRIEWSVIRDGVVLSASQTHLIGRRKSA